MNEEQVMHAMCIDDAYRVDRVLAQGPTGVTERVTIDGTGPFVRKKVPSRLVNRSVWAAISDCASPRLPQIAVTYETPDGFVAVYDYVPGATLEHIVATRGALPEADAIRIVGELCEALRDLHAHGVVHCDVAPSNVVVAADGAHLIDFGISRLVGEDKARADAPLGTWGFAAPEQFGFAPVDRRSDVYALSRLLGYMLTGSKPDDPLFDQAFSANVSPALQEIVRRGSAFEPSARFQSAAELARSLDAAVGAAGGRAAELASAACRDMGESAVVDDSPSSPRKLAGDARKPRFRVSVVAIVACACMLAALALFVFVSMSVKAPDSGQAVGSGSFVASPGTPEVNSSAYDAPADSGALPESGPVSAGPSIELADDDLSITESGWVMKSGYIHFCCFLTNSSETTACLFPSVKVVGRDASGGILFSSEQLFPGVQPGQTIALGSIVGSDVVPAAVEFEVLPPESYALASPAANPPRFEVGNLRATTHSGGYGTVTGEMTWVSGDFERDGQDGAVVTAVVRDASGKIVCGFTQGTGRIVLGKKMTFEVDVPTIPANASVEAYVYSL